MPFRKCYYSKLKRNTGLSLFLSFFPKLQNRSQLYSRTLARERLSLDDVISPAISSRSSRERRRLYSDSMRYFKSTWHRMHFAAQSNAPRYNRYNAISFHLKCRAWRRGENARRLRNIVLRSRGRNCTTRNPIGAESNPVYTFGRFPAGALFPRPGRAAKRG